MFLCPCLRCRIRLAGLLQGMSNPRHSAKLQRIRKDLKSRDSFGVSRTQRGGWCIELRLPSDGSHVQPRMERPQAALDCVCAFGLQICLRLAKLS
jgi:hypothetical protein